VLEENIAGIADPVGDSARSEGADITTQAADVLKSKVYKVYRRSI